MSVQGKYTKYVVSTIKRNLILLFVVFKPVTSAGRPWHSSAYALLFTFLGAVVQMEGLFCWWEAHPCLSQVPPSPGAVLQQSPLLRPIKLGPKAFISQVEKARNAAC